MNVLRSDIDAQHGLGKHSDVASMNAGTIEVVRPVLQMRMHYSHSDAGIPGCQTRQARQTTLEDVLDTTKKTDQVAS